MASHTQEVEGSDVQFEDDVDIWDGVGESLLFGMLAEEQGQLGVFSPSLSYQVFTPASGS